MEAPLFIPLVATKGIAKHLGLFCNRLS